MKAPAAILLGCLTVTCQQPDVDSVFRVTSALVQVDAVVTDSKGRHVKDLEAHDFAVFEDGKPQPLTHFSYVRVAADARPPATLHRGALPPPPSAPPRPENVRRTIVLMVDDLNLSFESTAFVRYSLRKFVENQMQPGDLVAVCRTGAGSGALQQFTVDKRRLLAVIAGLRWNPNGRYGASFFETLGKTPAPARVADFRELEVRHQAQRGRRFTVGTLGAVEFMVGALRELPGRKSIVLFSDGVALFQGVVKDAQDLGDTDEVLEAVHRLIDVASRAGTVIYTVHTVGLHSGLPGAEDNLRLDGLSPAKAKDRLEGIRDGWNKELDIAQQSLAYLAAETGGLAYWNSNDLNWALARILEDQAGYYLLGYRPPQGTFEDKGGRRAYSPDHRQGQAERAARPLPEGLFRAD